MPPLSGPLRSYIAVLGGEACADHALDATGETVVLNDLDSPQDGTLSDDSGHAPAEPGSTTTEHPVDSVAVAALPVLVFVVLDSHRSGEVDGDQTCDNVETETVLVEHPAEPVEIPAVSVDVPVDLGSPRSDSFPVLDDFVRPVHFIQSLSETDVVSSGQILASWNWLFLQISNNAKLPAAERDTLLEDFRKCGRHGLRITTLCAGSSTTVFVDRECRQQGCGVHAFWG